MLHNKSHSAAGITIVLVLLLRTISCSVASVCFGGVDDTPYLDWVKTNGDYYTASSCYNATSTNTTQGFAVHWNVDEENIHIAVAARAEGWVGFGIAETGGMKGADMVIFETANLTRLRDAHVLDERLPIDDDCQDWVFKDAHAGDGFLIFEAYRKLDTADTQDRAIFDDSDTAIPAQIVVAAWGESSTATFHGPSNVAQGSVRWYGTGDELIFVKEQLSMKADGFFDLTVNYTIKQQDTEYVDFCFTWDPDITDQGVLNGTITAIAAEVIPSEESRPFVHHADVFGAIDASNASKACLPTYGFTIFSWAPGVQPFVLPDEVGYKFGPTSDNSGLQSFKITIHYDNPNLIPGVVDTTTLRVHFSLTPRQHELGIMGMGDVLKRLKGVDVPAGRSQYDFTCKPDCSTTALVEPVTVFQEAYHMHKSGLAAATYHIRNDEIIREGHVDFFDFEQAGLPKIRQAAYTINPGDSFVSKFWFKSDNGTKFGDSSSEEMNEVFLLYYPAKSLFNVAPWGCSYDVPIGACNSSMSTRVLTSNDQLERIFGKTPSQCSPKATISNETRPTATSKGETVFHPIFLFLVVVVPFMSVNTGHNW